MSESDERTISWIATFFIFACLAALFGFTEVIPKAHVVSKTLFFVFLSLFVVTITVHSVRRGP